MTSRPHEPAPEERSLRRDAVRFVVMLGIVSLFADMTYEGARSAIGPWLGLLGASAAMVATLAGAGELLGYGIRLLSGWLSDRTGRYWPITLLGYALNLFAVPLLGLAGNWQAAGALMIAERVGRAIRSPARDAMLSHACTRMGLGWGFGLHEALDQTGAVLGPLVVAAMLAAGFGYRAAFGALAVPALCSAAVLVAARAAYPDPRRLEEPKYAGGGAARAGALPLYLAAVSLVAAGYVDFPLLGLHMARTGTLPESAVPLAYALAMATDAAAALLLGRLFDRHGPVVLTAATALTAFASPLVLVGGPAGAWAGMALWGVGMGAQESVMRATVALLVPADRRGTGFGLLNMIYGCAWFAGSVAIGLLYERGAWWAAAASFGLQAASLPLLALLTRRLGTASAAAQHAVS